MGRPHIRRGSVPAVGRAGVGGVLGARPRQNAEATASVANPAAIWHSMLQAVQSALPKRMRV
jgi:hypothetical protein